MVLAPFFAVNMVPCPFPPSGGISIKAAANMDLMRADMGGAATICSAIVSAAKLDLPINVVGAREREGVLESFWDPVKW